MSDEFHPLLQRQIRKHLGGLDNVPVELMPFIQAVQASYVHFENDRALLDRSMELSGKELWENNRLLQRKNEMLDAFVYRVSHDLKAPVNNVLALVEMIRETQADLLQGNPFFGRIVGNLENTTVRMRDRIADLLEISRMERSLDGKQEIVPLEPILVKVLDDLTVEIQKSNAEIDWDLGQPTICGSHENIYSLLSNLVSNAIKYRHPDRNPKVLVQSGREGSYDVIRVRDNGIGIDLDRHGKELFGMFNRFHTHVGGTGVGLFIIKKIIEKGGGKVHVDSKVNEGSTFSVFTMHRDIPAVIKAEGRSL